ncbi:Nuclear transcription factor Y subunit alpha like [Actinidia chinensis var. chinensis]|uniref:Nuclear transcription factor Y subunit alpha like n=1 Tax=Actinidia chinensis var. chinensis TaxID=1590841 RepID=A0A2R6PFC9_ACTCC|nr:Nuclear transcription factor Y subunit alpha like [Actinidia chinensis var. chinensis]
MGKQGKKHNHHKATRRGGGAFFNPQEEEEDHQQYPLHPPSASQEEEEEEVEEEGPIEGQSDQNPSINDVPSKFLLYQQSVQSPKGDISYLQKFFLMYVGGRFPLHLQEDFCGTALLSTEWLHTDSRRTAVGLDLDLEALNWCMENNVNKIGADVYSRLSLFHGNVLHPFEARLIKFENQHLIGKLTLSDKKQDGSDTVLLESTVQGNPCGVTNGKLMKDFPLPERDIICAFNYSCCCLHRRIELVSYFEHARNSLSRKGGIFVMDLYGGTSSECELRLQRKFPSFTYIWEQDGFDIVQRKTRISLHFHLQKQQKKLRHAFSYSWRLWSLPEIKDCLEEAGFRSVHFWIRQMPDAEEIKSIKGFGSGREVKYEEVSSFEQKDSWNAYVVGVAP